VNNLLKDKIQQEALGEWIKNGKVGTCEIITGLGKTFISLHALYTMPKDDVVHLFLAETTSRELDLIEDIKKYNKFFKRDVFKDYNLKFYCYQTVYKWKDKTFGLIIADEIQDSLSPSYIQFYFNNKYEAIIGLSATITRHTRYIIEDIPTTKGELLDKIAPVCYKYTLDQGQSDNTARDLNVYIIFHDLDDTTKNISAGNTFKRFFQTEKSSYEYWDKEHKKSWFIEDDEELKQLKIRVTANKRSTILYNLFSKIRIVKILLANLFTKTIIFSNSLDSLLKITPNIISSRNTDKKNDEIRSAFDNNKIKVIGSFKKLKQGANLKDLDNCIIMSYYSTDKDLIQRVGRLRNNGEIGNVFIIVTKDTQEEIWFIKMMENINNLNLIYCKNIEECILKLNK